MAHLRDPCCCPAHRHPRRHTRRKVLGDWSHEQEPCPECQVKTGQHLAIPDHFQMRPPREMLRRRGEPRPDRPKCAGRRLRTTPVQCFPPLCQYRKLRVEAGLFRCHSQIASNPSWCCHDEWINISTFLTNPSGLHCRHIPLDLVRLNRRCLQSDPHPFQFPS